MAARAGTFLSAFSFEYGSDNVNISDEVNEYTPAEYAPLAYFVDDAEMRGSRSAYRIAPSNRWPIVGTEQSNFFRDFYFRIHVRPLFINLQTVASSQSREVTVWNAYPYTTAELNDILLSNPVGIDVTGQAIPFSIPPLKELTYDITVGVSGPPVIDVEIQFDFTNVPNPLPVVVIGNRAIKFDLIPESPVNEVWEWLTDNIRTIDGSEQRIALRGETPRIQETLKVVFTTQPQLRKFYSDLLACVGRFWIPEFQYAARITAASFVSGTQIYFNVEETDIRPGEYALIHNSTFSSLVEIEELNAFGATITSPLTFDIPLGCLIMPGSSALINNNTKLSRYAVNEVGETTLACKMLRQREFLERPGSTVTLPTFLSDPVMDKRPLANDFVDDAVSTGQQNLDNQTGIVDIISRWTYSRVTGDREFKVNRMKRPEEMDYWKAFFAYARGDCRKFWMPTYRPDMQVLVTPSETSNNLIIEGHEYGEKIYTIETHKYIELETNSGIHRCSVIGATIGETGGVDSTTIVISPPLPAGAGWTHIKRVSYLLPVRLGDSKVSWKHFGLESLLQFSIITAEV